MKEQKALSWYSASASRGIRTGYSRHSALAGIGHSVSETTIPTLIFLVFSMRIAIDNPIVVMYTAYVNGYGKRLL
jgi:hypothetical protein